jgi:hypothetical protein
MVVKHAKRERQAKEQKDFAIEVAKAGREKYDMRRQQAREAKLREMRERDNRGVKEYQNYLKGVEERRLQKSY